MDSNILFIVHIKLFFFLSRIDFNHFFFLLHVIGQIYFEYWLFLTSYTFCFILEIYNENFKKFSFIKYQEFY